MEKTESIRLSEDYLMALKVFIDQGQKCDLQLARQMGSQAVTLTLETLDLAKIHEQALVILSRSASSTAARENIAVQGAIFFSEAILPIEANHIQTLKVGTKLKKLSEDLQRNTQELVDSHRELQQSITLRKAAEKTLRTSGNESTKLLAESLSLQRHLQDMARQIMSTQEDSRKIVSLKLQDEIAQALLGIHIRLLALKNEIYITDEAFKKEIAVTEQLVEKSAEAIRRCSRELSAHDED